MPDSSGPQTPEWATPDESFPYFPVGIIGAGLGWAALNGLTAVLQVSGLNPFLGWGGLLVFCLAFALVLGSVVFGVRRGLHKPDRFGSETALVLLGGGLVGAVLIGIMIAAMSLV